MATGSYEGSLPMEGTPDHHEPSTFTSRRSRWSWRLPHISQACTSSQWTGGLTRRRRPSSKRVEEGEATGVSEVRSYEGSVGRKRPRSRHHPGETQTWAARVFWRQHSGGKRVLSIHQSGSGVVKTHGPPVKPHRAQTRWGAHAGKLAVVNAGSTRGGGYTQFCTGSRSRSDASRVLSAGRLQGLVAIKAGR